VNVESTASVAQALAHPIRLRILELLRDEGAYVMHLTSMIGRPQANISQHLSVLKDARLVIDQRVGMSVIYRVRDSRVFEIVEQLAMLVPDPVERSDRYWRRDVHGHGRAGDRSQHCRCPRCGGQ